MTDEARALLIVAALLSGASGSAGFVGGRMSVPAPPAEVRYVPIPAAAALAPALPDAAPTPPAAVVPAAPAIVPPVEPPAASAAPVEAKPVPPARPKVDAKPKEPPPKPQKSRPPPAPKKTLPSCAVVQREYQRMTWAQQMAAYRRATTEEIAHGKRCLGF